MNRISAIPSPARARDPNGPLARVLALGRADRTALLVCLALAVGAHGTAGARVLQSQPYLTELASAVRSEMRERLRSQVDIDVEKLPPPPPPPPPPEPEPEVPPPPPVAKTEAPPPETAPPPAAAEAGKVLTAEPDPNEPVDLTNEGFVTGTGDSFAGGVTASSGTSKVAVRNTAAVATGVGTGMKPVGPPTPKVDLSRPPRLMSGTSWNECGFPPEADAEGLNSGKVKLVVTVGTNGRAKSVTVLTDPGFGFGSLARRCAYRKTWEPGLNAAGQPVEQTTPLSVTFVR
jgi:periplasmic protein TonB